ncbi:MAG TPA: DUF998 domain-containing protein, partial [Ktedonobacterales bacterium]|nr:DUF998 domain-containing protein [Ktedonobacterales bacterium]
GATRPGYSAWRNYGSSLSTGPGGWMQIVNFIVCGVLTLAFVVGLRRILRSGKGAVGGPILLGIFGLGLVAAGIFVTDPSLGYPPGTQGHGPQTLHGTIHGLAGLVVFFSLAAACFVLARRFAGDPRGQRWALYSIMTGTIVAVSFVSSTVMSVLDETGVVPNGPTGLLQRIGIIAGWGWVSLLAFRLLRVGSTSAVQLR